MSIHFPGKSKIKLYFQNICVHFFSVMSEWRHHWRPALDATKQEVLGGARFWQCGEVWERNEFWQVDRTRLWRIKRLNGGQVCTQDRRDGCEPRKGTGAAQRGLDKLRQVRNTWQRARVCMCLNERGQGSRGLWRSCSVTPSSSSRRLTKSWQPGQIICNQVRFSGPVTNYKVIGLQGEVPACQSAVVILHRVDPGECSMVSFKVKLAAKQVIL